MRYIRGDFAGAGTVADPFSAPDGWRHVVDMRRADGSGGGVFAGADALPVPAGASELQLGGLTGPALDALWDELTVNADPLGLTAPKTIMPTTATGRMTLWLPDGEVGRTLELVPGDPEWASVIGMERLGYLEKRADARQGWALRPVFDLNGRQVGTVVDMQFHRRYLAVLAEKYGIDYREFQRRDSDIERAVLGHELPDESPLEHSTTLTEDFDQSDSSTLGPDQTWTEVKGNLQTTSNELADAGNNDSSARVEADLAGTDMDVSLDITANTGATSTQIFMGTRARFQPGADSGYVAFLARGTTLGEDIILQRIAAGTPTGLATASETFSLPDKVTTRVDGSDISALFNDSVKLGPITNTAFTSGTRAGVYTFVVVASAQNIRGDNWEAKDLAPADTSDIEAAAATQMPVTMAPLPAQVVGY